MSIQRFKLLNVLSASELKQLCRDAQMKVSGTRREMVLRLLGIKDVKTRISMNTVNRMLEKEGVTNISSVSRCLRVGIRMGYIDISGDKPLDNVVISDACFLCHHKLEVAIRDLLYQPDHPRYGSTGLDAAVKCPNKTCKHGLYVTGMCCDSMYINSGEKFFHFGECYGDYLKEVCEGCGCSFYSCRGRFQCPCVYTGTDYGTFDEAFLESLYSSRAREYSPEDIYNMMYNDN
ncbi:uncharacterized protein LOC117113493 isoform X2 [Anneissia japonica]|nr:uncharacterized protein LOC117113493 isoform X2 [Anneissia japonica]XP_033112730.1 uncharacterized protein LOC117113493 isoform X2 [Anneissia japonica]